LLAAGVVWLLIFGAGAVAYRTFVAPKKKEEVVKRTESTRRHAQQVRLALDSFSGYCLFRSREFAAELDTRNIGLELVDDKADYTQRLTSLADGSTPLAVFTIDALIKTSAVRGELPATVVMMVDETTGADAMLAYKQAVPNIDALNRADARIVVTRDSPSETLARVVTSTFQLPKLPDDYLVDAQGAADAYQQLTKAKPSEPRAFVLWEPYVSKALANPAVHTLIDSSRFRGYIVDVLVVERNFLLQNRNVVNAVVEAYQTVAYQRRQSAAGMRDLVMEDAKQQGEPLTKEQAQRLVDGVWWKNTQENYAHFGLQFGPRTATTPTGVQRIDEMIRKITKVLLETKAIDRDPTGGSPNKLYYDQILSGMMASQWHPAAMPAGGADTVRADAARTLEDEEWNRLTPVGHLQVDRIVFARGRAELIGASEATLTQLADTLRSFPRYYLIVRGHARTDGDADANRKLALDRAAAVAEALVSQGIARQRVRALGTEPAGAGGEAQAVTFVLGQTPF
jgi:outer membrane protein OmpA-like peptidoglycan-associated protein